MLVEIPFHPGVHPNVSLVRRVYDALRSGDEQVFAALFAEDVSACTADGDGNLRMEIGRQAALSALRSCGHAVHIERIVADDRAAVAIQVGDDPGEVERPWRLAVFAVEDGVVVGVRTVWTVQPSSPEVGGR